MIGGRRLALRPFYAQAMDQALDIGDAYLVLGAADDRAASSEGTALLNNDHALQSSPAAALAMYNRRRLRSGGGGSAENVDTACPWELGDDQGTVRKLSGAREIVPNPGRSTFAVRERDATARSAWQANS